MQPSSVESSILHADTAIGAVQLTVTDLDRSIDFYRSVIGFRVHERSDGQANLGAGGPTLLQLVENPSARRVTNHSGLYHFAVLTPTRPALGQVLRRIVDAQVRLGGSDHSVSEALYFDDPDGNGIEVYRDRPRSDWQYADGKPLLGNAPLDYRGILNEADGVGDGLDPDTVIGHVHLHVGQLTPAMNFYIDTVGFDLIMTWQGAAFYSAGGYHHHLATNTWAGVGAAPQPADAVGLRHYEVVLADVEERTRLVERFDAAGVAYESRSDGLFARDPAQNGVLFVVN
ncbi:MAG: VOC family protein [Caldilineaceae bacterium]|nr:VOC family protein [Caldilineaceae bacterium]